MKGIRLTRGDLARLDRAQRALLSPPGAGAGHAEAWQLRANAAVREVLGADHSVFSLPGPAGPGLVTEDTDPSFPDRLLGYYTGVEAGEYRFSDPYVENAGRIRRAGGTGVYHERMLGSREALERSPAYQEIFVPAGLTHMIGFSTPLPVGEATQFFSFAGSDGARRSARGMTLLRLLVPAFGAGVRAHGQIAAWRAAFLGTLDRLEWAGALFSADGVALHRSRALGDLLADDAESERVWQSACALARRLAGDTASRGGGREDGPPVPDARAHVRTRAARYRLLGSYLDADPGGSGGVLVTVECARPLLPAAGELCGRFGLTPRESEVALLLAEGLTDATIACRLALSPHTIRRYTERVLSKLGVHSRAAVALTLMRGA